MLTDNDFARCESLFKNERINELNDEIGNRFLKLRSLNRSKYLKNLLDDNNINTENLKVTQQLKSAFLSDITTENIESFIRKHHITQREERALIEEKLVNELYNLKVFDWGGLHQNSLEKTIVDNYIKKIPNYEEIENVIETELQASLRGYVLCSWYNHWTSIIIEDVFKDHDRILPALGLIPKVDFFIDNVPFDLKVTYLPEGFVSYKRREHNLRPELTMLKQDARAKNIPIDSELASAKQLENLWTKLSEFSHEDSVVNDLQNFRLKIVEEIQNDSNELMRWLYENQGVRRFDASNRLFIILVNTSNFFEGWKMKRAIPLIRKETQKFLNEKVKIGNKINFDWEGDEYLSLADALVIRN